jgi:hypothetical protein
MYYNLFLIAVVVLSAEMQCQRHIIGSRLLDFDNPMKFSSSLIRQGRNSKDVKFGQISLDTSNIRTVMDSSFDNPEPKLVSSVNDQHEFEECVPLDKCESLDWLVQNIDTVPNLSSSQVIDKVKERICGFYGRTPKVRCPIDDDNDIEDTDEYDEDYDYGGFNDEDVNRTTKDQESIVLNDQINTEKSVNQGLFFAGSEDNNSNKTHQNKSGTVGNALNGVGKAFNGVNQNADNENKEETIYPDVESRAVFTNIGIPSRQRCKGSLLIHHSASIGGPLEDFKQMRLRGRSFRQMRKLRDRNIIQMQTQGNCCWKIYSMRNFRGIEEQFYNGYNIVPRVHPKSIKGSYCS